MQSACGYLPLIGLSAQESRNIKVITCIVESALRAACGFRLFARIYAIVIAVLHHVTLGRSRIELVLLCLSVSLLYRQIRCSLGI